jgi:hypothetical protein
LQKARPNKLECLYLAITFQSSLTFAGAYPRRNHLKGPPIGFALALPSNSKNRLERVSKGKPSSLLGLVISDKGKQFYNIDTRGPLKMVTLSPESAKMFASCFDGRKM